MDPHLADRVKETSTTTGTGALALAGALPGFRSFLAGIGNGVNLYYSIVHRSAAEWEVGIGQLSGGATLARTTVLASSNAGALVNFSAGTKDVFSTIPAALFDSLGGGDIGTGHGRLVFVSATQIAFRPLNGRLLPVKDASGWRNRSIGAGIISGNPANAVRVNGTPNQGLAVDTTYLVTVFDAAGALEFDFLTNLAHEADAATGVEIAQANDSHTVVGMVRAIAGPAFGGEMLVLSWFNRAPKSQVKFFTADRSTGSTTYVELNAEIRNAFLSWANEAVHLAYDGSYTNSATRGVNATGIAIDGTVPQAGLEGSSSMQTAGDTQACPVAGMVALAEGYHYATLLGKVNSGSGLWPFASNVQMARSALHVTVRG
jgi:hypothetical protein